MTRYNPVVWANLISKHQGPEIALRIALHHARLKVGLDFEERNAYAVFFRNAAAYLNNKARMLK